MPGSVAPPTLLLIALCLAAPSQAEAQNRRRNEGPVFVDPAHVDEDYALQGEYRGWQRESIRSATRPAGLQVVALGNAQFGASNTIGGLPGEGWFGGERRLFAGERSGRGVSLQHRGSERLLVGIGFATLYDRDGRKLGEFRRIERQSPTLGAMPPFGAKILFLSGKPTEHFVAPTITEEGLLLAGTETTQPYGSFRLHAEFRLPYKPQARGQARGNSGFYLQGRYEVQVLDSFGLEGVENECGALYRTRRPDFNMCFPPLVWQTYDIDFTTPRFDNEGNKLSNMHISVWHNGVLIHNDAEIPGKTGAGRPEAPEPLPTKLQDHSNPVVFRNIWLIEKHPPQLASLSEHPPTLPRD
jgi:hypothetical protein